MDFVSSLSSTSWYFLLATLLPIFATLLALIWGYYSSSVRKKNASQKQLLKGGSFGYNIVKDKNFDDYYESPVSDKVTDALNLRQIFWICLKVKIFCFQDEHEKIDDKRR